MAEVKLYRQISRHSQKFTWSWYIMPLATLGVALILDNEPHRFHALTTIGKVVYLFAITQFVILTCFVTWRIFTETGWFRRSLSRPSEALSFATTWLSFGNILAGGHSYAQPREGSHLANAMIVFFWIYVAIAYLLSIVLNVLLYTGEDHLMLPNMTPAWMLPIFPVILSGTIASIISTNIEPVHALPILIGGLTFQGLGTLISLLVTAIYLHRLFRSGLPDPGVRPAMFLAVGPPASTAIAMIRLADNIPTSYSYFSTHPNSAYILQVLSVFIAIFFWAYAFWMFSLALLCCLMSFPRLPFHLSWYSFVFPNCGFTIATIDIGRALDSDAILWVATAMTLVNVVVWLFVMGAHLRTAWLGRTLS
ncbi:C4-dicarboxylate transporter/malic acid transport protein [Mollisia scopiformis]|uniref:C4-dicarboxylate transporter/malic acid transport protein n=1 Tax=Mollisia scopiformis TaxID=149040 RepID=A0A132B5P2_MOLSC|nr:C4-dicarboxylate transporter/malic acid transport protein [Mollisia scopiformis]KUJ07661.1 C4-dicarboxylate transporter/malic acid transport protein [Mollisia scopiformis]